MNEERVYRAALEKWGADAQTLMAFEEMAELQKELCKHARGRNNTAAIAEEIADVEIMLGQMKILHNCADMVEEYRESKLRRLADRCGVEVPPPGASVAGMIFRNGRAYFQDGTEPVKLGPGVSFRVEDTRTTAPCDPPDGAEWTLKDLIRQIVREMFEELQGVEAVYIADTPDDSAGLGKIAQEMFSTPGRIVELDHAEAGGTALVLAIGSGSVTLRSLQDVKKLIEDIEKAVHTVWPQYKPVWTKGNN